MERTITKLDEFTIKIEWTTPYTQQVTKDQLIQEITNIDNQILWLNNRIAELQNNKLEVQALLDESTTKWCLTRDERQALQPKTQ
jgi:flagellar biosynthesis chaperone FliJ